MTKDEKVYLDEKTYIIFRFSVDSATYFFMHSYNENPQESLYGTMSVNHIVNKTIEYFQGKKVTVAFEPQQMFFLEIHVE